MTAKTKEATPFDNYKNDNLTRPKNLAFSNWAKFEKVGDKAQGWIRDAFFQAEKDGFPAKRGITLEQTDGTLINVAIKRLEWVLKDTDDMRLGDPLTIEFIELGEKVPGKNPAKIFGFYGQKLPENDGNKTVLELDLEDQKAGGTVAPLSEADKAFAGIDKDEPPVLSSDKKEEDAGAN